MVQTIRRIWNQCKRWKNVRGFGVQSPSDFFLVSFVIYERTPFHAYALLEEVQQASGLKSDYRRKVNRLLLRLVNHYQPQTVIEVGTGNGWHTEYLFAGNRRMTLYTFDTEIRENVARRWTGQKRIHYHTYEEWNVLPDTAVDFIHIAQTEQYADHVERLLPYVHRKTCMVIERPYINKEKALWWKTLLTDPRIRISFDLYELGILLFDTDRYKENYTINFY